VKPTPSCGGRRVEGLSGPTGSWCSFCGGAGSRCSWPRTSRLEPAGGGARPGELHATGFDVFPSAPSTAAGWTSDGPWQKLSRGPSGQAGQEGGTIHLGCWGSNVGRARSSTGCSQERFRRFGAAGTRARSDEELVWKGRRYVSDTAGSAEAARWWTRWSLFGAAPLRAVRARRRGGLLTDARSWASIRTPASAAQARTTGRGILVVNKWDLVQDKEGEARGLARAKPPRPAVDFAPLLFVRPGGHPRHKILESRRAARQPPGAYPDPQPNEWVAACRRSTRPRSFAVPGALRYAYQVRPSR